MKRLLALACLAVGTGAAAHDIATRELGSGQYQLTLTADEELTVERAQELLRPRAAELCGALPAQLGHFEFESRVPMPGQPPGATASFRLTQDVSCGEAGPPPPEPAGGDGTLGVTREGDGQNLQEFIRAASLDYLERRASGDFKGAYRLYATSMHEFSPYDEWRAQNEAANRETGTLKDMEVWRVTVYDHPPNAPKPGIYVAADYEGRYQKGDIHCGYLIWFGVTDRQFVITREETGYLKPEVLASLKPEQAAEFRRQMKCRP